MGFTRVLGGILSFALLHNPIQALGATIPPEQSVTLAWSPVTNADLTGYNVYYGSASHTYTNITSVRNVTNATISGLTEGVTYYFAATTLGTSGLESGYSAEISYMVPNPARSQVKLQVTPARRFVLTVTGTIGRTYNIQASQDLITWTIIGTVTVGTNGSVDFVDTNATSFLRRFYRARG